jgi:predicted regulator of Ras-like GTPase activity (Roadblock/LC7/MglB family)
MDPDQNALGKGGGKINMFGAPVPRREPTPTKPAGIEGIILEITSLLGVSALLIVDENGEVEHQWYRTLLDRSKIEVTGIDIKQLVDLAMNFISRIGGGGADNMILRSENSTVLIQGAYKRTIFIYADKRANLALLMIRAKRVAQLISTPSSA